MKLSGAALPVFFAGVLLSSTAAAEGTTALILKTGQFTLSEDSQVVLFDRLEFDDKSSGVFGAELEWRMPDGLSLGGELTFYRNDWASAFFLFDSGQVDTTILMFNVKKYFTASKVIHPYIGAGAGVAVTDFSGTITGNSSGLALQAIGGIEFRWDKVGLYTEFKALSADTEDDLDHQVDVSGTGIFAGLSIYF